MMRRAVVSFGLVLLFLVSVFPISTFSGKDSGVSGGVEFTLTADPQEISAGELANITITATNLNDYSITLYPRLGSDIFDIIAWNSTFCWLWSDGRAFPDVYFPPFILNSNETYVEQRNWNLFIWNQKCGALFPPQEGSYCLGIIIRSSMQMLNAKVNVTIVSAQTVIDGGHQVPCSK
jgi:hypothetical protein